MQKHQDVETLQMIERVGCPIVRLDLHHFEPQRDNLIHYLERKWELHVELPFERFGGFDLKGL